jgi:phenylacetate-CoA ligase
MLLDLLEEKSVTPAELSLSKALFGAESWNESFRADIEEQLELSVTDNYGLTEVMGPGVSFECEEKKGLHISEDHFIPEIIDPDSGEILSEGEKGELVLTTITKEGYPLIRYRTGDITSLRSEPCSCGREFIRMSRVVGRVDDMIILNGQNMFPTQFEQILTDVVGKTPNYQLLVDRKENIDELEIQIEVPQDIFNDEMKTLNRIERDVLHEVKEKLDFVPKVTLVEPRSIVRKMKQSRVIDLRKND